MQISAGQDGIQRLLKAEQEAQSIVTAARKGKANLKQALHLKVQDSRCEHSAVAHCRQDDAIIKPCYIAQVNASFQSHRSRCPSETILGVLTPLQRLQLSCCILSKGVTAVLR